MPIFHILLEEMDWDNNGMVTFKEFLFAFTRWVGIGENLVGWMFILLLI
jgi:calcium-binding protein CML